LTAVVGAVTYLEDDPRFNADLGSQVRSDGRTMQLDASCMTSDNEFGAVACVENILGMSKILQEDHSVKPEINFEKITDIMPEVIIVLDEDLNIVWANKKAVEAALSPPLNQKCYKVYMDSNKPCENCHTLKTFDSGKNIFNVSEVSYPDGSVKKFEGYTAVAAVDQNGNPALVAEIARHVSKRAGRSKESGPRGSGSTQ